MSEAGGREVRGEGRPDRKIGLYPEGMCKERREGCVKKTSENTTLKNKGNVVPQRADQERVSDTFSSSNEHITFV